MKTSLEEEEIKLVVEEKILKDISSSYKSNPYQGLVRICPICSLTNPTLVFQNHLKVRKNFFFKKIKRVVLLWYMKKL
jgi:hypothetical protein